MIFANIRNFHKIIFTFIYLFSIIMTVFFLLFPVSLPVKLFVLASSFFSSLFYFSFITLKIIIDTAEGCIFIANECYSMDKIIFREYSKFDNKAGYMIRLKGKILKVNIKCFFLTETIRFEIYNYLRKYYCGGVVFDSYEEKVPG